MSAMSDNDWTGIDMVGAVQPITQEGLSEEAREQEDADFREQVLRARRNNKQRTRHNEADNSQATGTEDCTYTHLLERLFAQLDAENPEVRDRSTATLPRPQVRFTGSRRTTWVNFPEICDALGREREHVQKFFQVELSTQANLDGKNHLVLLGRWKNSHVERVLRQYVEQFVTCKSCRRLQTSLTKLQLTCQVCGAERFVGTIKDGYVAARKGERQAARLAAASGGN